jgi:hypothetical protein
VPPWRLDSKPAQRAKASVRAPLALHDCVSSASSLTHLALKLRLRGCLLVSDCCDSHFNSSHLRLAVFICLQPDQPQSFTVPDAFAVVSTMGNLPRNPCCLNKDQCGRAGLRESLLGPPGHGVCPAVPAGMPQLAWHPSNCTTRLLLSLHRQARASGWSTRSRHHSQLQLSNPDSSSSGSCQIMFELSGVLGAL